MSKHTTARATYKTLAVRDRLAYRIAEYCDCKSWLDKSRGTIVYFGLRSDAEFADWLTVSLDDFVQRSATAYMATNPALPTHTNMPRLEAQKAFILGAIGRINERLTELTRERKRQQQTGSSDGRALVVVKNQIVTQAFAELGLRLRSGGRSSARARDGGAYSAGREAGDRASFGRPVNGGSGVLRLGGK